MRVRHDMSVATIDDDRCRRFAIGAPDASSIVNYWTATTRQFLEVECDLLPWYDVSLPARATRVQSIEAALEAARADHRDLSRYAPRDVSAPS